MGRTTIALLILLAEVFPDREILHTVCAKLSWSHLKLLIGIEDRLKRDFYIQIAQFEQWSVRQLQERLNSMLFERTALSHKPEDTIRHDLDQLRQHQIHRMLELLPVHYQHTSSIV